MPIDPRIALGVQPPQIADPVERILTLRQLARQLQGQQRQQADVEALDAAFAHGDNREAILQSVPGHLRSTVLKSFDEADQAAERARKSKAESASADADYFGALAAGVKPFLDDPQQAMGAVKTALSHAKSQGYEQADAIWQQLQQNPQALPQVVEGLLQQSPKFATLATQQQTAKARQESTAAQREETMRHNRESERIANLNAGREAAQAAETARHNKATEGAATAGVPPLWTTDASRPSGAEANKVDPNLRMTPNAIYQAAINYIQTGHFPPTGLGGNPWAVAVRTAVSNKAGAIAADAGMDIPALAAAFKSNQASLTQQQKFFDAAQSFLSTADKNAELLNTTLKKLPDTGSPIFNQPLRTFEKKVAGDVNMSQFGTYLRSVQNEYAKIISNPNLAGQLTDAARQEAEQLIQPDATVQQIMASVQALQNEGGNRLISAGEQIRRIQTRMAVKPTTSTSATSLNPTNGPTPDLSGLLPGRGRKFSSGPYAGQTWMIGPDGQPKRVN